MSLQSISNAALATYADYGEEDLESDECEKEGEGEGDEFEEDFFAHNWSDSLMDFDLTALTDDLLCSEEYATEAIGEN